MRLADRSRLVVALVALVVAAAVGPHPAPAGASPSYDFSAVDSRLTTATAGCSVTCGVVLHVQRLDAAGSEGPKDQLLFDAWGIFATDRIVWTASAGKLITGITVASVIDDGLLDLDTTVGEVFPAHAGTTKGGITLKMLMAHTSGWTDPASCLGDATTTLEACADSILALPLRFTPGTRFAYAGPPMQVAARMVEVVTGKPFVQVFAENVKTPLGLPTMAWGSSTNPRVDGGTQPTGLRAGAADYIPVLEMLLDRGRFRGSEILSPAAFDALISDHTAGSTTFVKPYDEAIGYGLGLWVEAKDGSGATVRFSSPGAFGSVPWVDYERGYAGWWQTQGDANKIKPLFWGEILPAIQHQIDTVPVGTPPPASAPATVTGVSPTAGPSAGGQTVTITGSGFTGATGVRFSSTSPAASFTVVSDSQIVAVSPARVAGLVNVLVDNPHGTSTVGSQTLYKFHDLPVITSITPSSSGAAGGGTVTIRGSGFGGATAVRFGPSTYATGVKVWAPDVITAVVPPRPAALVNVFVEGPGGRSATSSATLFSYGA